MTPERWQKINEIFQAALSCDSKQRVAILDEACLDDQSLRDEVEALLIANDQASTFIQGSAVTAAAQLILSEQDASLPVERIGPYRILSEIGRGGMGAVYLAERDDDEYRKQVAIKLIKRGMDTDSILHRFRTERQILARLEHSNIARLLDGGTTSDGLPYFVMEYVEGLPIDRYAVQQNLSVNERLHLFLQVCAALQHSHQNLIVHRDIKPNNIIVTTDGTPKLLDFGIAKLVTPDTGVAETGSAIDWMTPEYSSPEQLRGESITTANDVYSLGVVLYELLTGRRPYSFTDHSPVEMVEVILRADPDRPSTVTAHHDPTTVQEDALTAVPAESTEKLRRNSAEKLRRKLSGDLDNIVLKAMHREKEMRYRSVAQFADDIRRHLEGRPVLARKDTLFYRTWKFIGRNQVAVSAGVLLMLILIAGIASTVWQSRQASAQRDLALAAQKKSERRFDDIRKLARAVVFDYHDAIRDLPGSTPIRENMVKDALEYLNNLAEDSAVDTALQIELADAYEKISYIQGGAKNASLGNTVGAMESLRRCLMIRQALLSAYPNDTELITKMADGYRRLADLSGEVGDVKGVMESYRSAADMLETLTAKEPTNRKYRFQLATTLDGLGNHLMEQGDWNGALEQERRAMGIYELLLADNPQHEATRRALAVTHELIGQMLLQIDDKDGAKESMLKAIQILTKLVDEKPVNAEYRRVLGTCYYYQGDILAAKNNIVQALDSYRKSITIYEQLSAADPKNVTLRMDIAFAYHRIADMLTEAGDHRKAVAHFRRSLAVREEVASADPANVWKRWVLIEGGAATALALAQTGDWSASLEQCRKVIALIDATDEQSETSELRNARANACKHVADAYMVIAATGSSSNERPSYWQTARHLYQKGLDIWLDMKVEGTLSATEETSIEDAKQAIIHCEARLAK